LNWTDEGWDFPVDARGTPYNRWLAGAVASMMDKIAAKRSSPEKPQTVKMGENKKQKDPQLSIFPTKPLK